MAIFFNGLGLAWLIAGFGAAIGLQNANIFVGKEGENFGLIACGVMLIADLLYRATVSRPKMARAEGNEAVLNSNVGTHWAFGPTLGGSVMFIPAWATAMLAFVVISFVF